MRLVVFGATGQTGMCLVEQALAQNHFVTAFVRDSARLAIRHAALDVVVGDVATANDVESAIAGKDVVLLALGVKLGVADQVCTIATRNVIAAMDKHGVRRLINVSGVGTGPARKQLSPLGLLIASGLRMLDRHAFRDKESQDELLVRSGLDWVNVCPPWLTQGERTGVYRFGCELRPKLNAQIARADVADFMLKQLSDTAFVRKCPILFY